MRALTIALLLALPVAGHAQRVSEIRTVSYPRVEAPDAAASLSGVTAVQESGRYTKKGAVIGAIAGTVTGLGIGTFIALFCEAESDDCGNVIIPITLIGAVSGAVSGAIIGAAIPRRPRGAVAAPVADTDRTTGSASFDVGVAAVRLEDDSGNDIFNGGGAAVRANVYAELKPWLAIGPEGGYALFDEGGRIRWGAVAVRLSRHGERVTPYVAANLGAYQTTLISTEYLGGGVSAGARINPTASHRFFVDVNARYHQHAQNIAPMHMSALAIGLGTRW